MTYCLAIQLTDQLVFASDSRTSAGVANVSIYSKMHVFPVSEDRFFTLPFGSCEKLLHDLLQIYRAHTEDVLGFEHRVAHG